MEDHEEETPCLCGRDPGEPDGMYICEFCKKEVADLVDEMFERAGR